jgi:hypothetical protein
VFRPVRARLGTPVGVLAAFVVSGVMHEAMFSYVTLLPPTGEVTVFFTLHGACAVAEGWWAAHEGWPRTRRNTRWRSSTGTERFHLRPQKSRSKAER